MALINTTLRYPAISRRGVLLQGGCVLKRFKWNQSVNLIPEVWTGECLPAACQAVPACSLPPFHTRPPGCFPGTRSRSVDISGIHSPSDEDKQTIVSMVMYFYIISFRFNQSVSPEWQEVAIDRQSLFQHIAQQSGDSGSTAPQSGYQPGECLESLTAPARSAGKPAHL